MLSAIPPSALPLLILIHFKLLTGLAKFSFICYPVCKWRKYIPARHRLWLRPLAGGRIAPMRILTILILGKRARVSAPLRLFPLCGMRPEK